MTHPFPTRRSSDLTFDEERQTGISLSIDAEGRLAARMGQPGGTATTVALSHPLQRHRWYHIWLSVDLQQGQLVLGQIPIAPNYGFDQACTDRKSTRLNSSH